MAKKIVVASGKGGVGKTTFTVALAKALTALGNKVLIIDCDRLRSVDILMGVSKDLVYDFGDVVLGRCTAEEAVYEKDGVGVVSSPHDYEGITDEGMKKMLESYDCDYNFVLLDAPAGIGRGLKLACAGADSGIVVSTPDLVCVRSACTAARQMELYGVKSSRLIINRVQKKDVRKGRLLNVDKVIDETQVQLLGALPEDEKLRLGAMGGAVYKKRQVSYKAFSNIAKRICGQYIALFEGTELK